MKLMKHGDLPTFKSLPTAGKWARINYLKDNIGVPWRYFRLARLLNAVLIDAGISRVWFYEKNGWNVPWHN